MQHALATSSVDHLSTAATAILREREVQYDTDPRGHRALSQLVDKEKDKIQGEEVLQILHCRVQAYDD